MERLTTTLELNGEKYISLVGCDKHTCECDGFRDRYDHCGCPKITDVITKLRNYEDAEEDGSLVRPPCKVGDPIYYVSVSNTVLEYKVKELILRSDGWYAAFSQATGKIGEGVFLTREEAEKTIDREFVVKFCDNNIDEYFEKFPYSALCELEPLVIGKSIALPDGKTAKIYKAKIERDCNKKTINGDPFYDLKCWAKTTSIYGHTGDKVHIGCSVSHNTCSICGKEYCEHQHGKIYDGQLCYGVLTGIKDIYDIILKD